MDDQPNRRRDALVPNQTVGRLVSIAVLRASSN
jgi:hypothetical protein